MCGFIAGLVEGNVSGMTEYQWTRPDGTVLYRAIIADYLGLQLPPDVRRYLLAEPVVLLQFRQPGGAWSPGMPLLPLDDQHHRL